MKRYERDKVRLWIGLSYRENIIIDGKILRGSAKRMAESSSTSQTKTFVVLARKLKN